MADMLSVLSSLLSVTSFTLIVSCLILFVIHYFKRKYSYWERHGVPYLKPALFFGNTKDLIFKRVPPAFVFQRIYKELEGHKFGGFYQLTKPTLMLRDPELIKSVLVKNFSHFQDRPTYLNEKLDPLTTHLVNLTGQRWKDVRLKLRPAFSSVKLRHMQELIKDCIKELDDYLTKDIGADSKTAGEHDLRELMTDLSIDTMGSCAFGLRCNAIRDRNSDFSRMGRLSSRFNFRSHIQSLLLSFNPWLVHIFDFKRHNPEVEEFFTSVIREAIRYRETNGHKKDDFLQQLISIQAEEKQQVQIKGHHQQTKVHGNTSKESTETLSDILFTDNVVFANAYLFFANSIDTNALTLSYCLYEMALNPDICEKTRAEVESVKQAHDGKLDYDVMKELKFMDAVISETLRKYTISPILRRRCTEPFQIPGTSYVIEKGMEVNISLYGLHQDPEYFPDPEKFLPERFSEGNKHTIKPGTYMPFGDGPRICLGLRFSQFEIKLVLAHLVCNFTMHPCEKTVVPLKFDRHAVLHTPQGGIWVRFQKRPMSREQ